MLGALGAHESVEGMERGSDVFERARRRTLPRRCTRAFEYVRESGHELRRRRDERERPEPNEQLQQRETVEAYEALRVGEDGLQSKAHSLLVRAKGVRGRERSEHGSEQLQRHLADARVLVLAEEERSLDDSGGDGRQYFGVTG